MSKTKMDYFYANSIFLLCFTPIIGSLVAKMTIHFAGKEASLTLGRSYCDACLRPYPLIEKIPLFNYIFTRGRCKLCNKLKLPIYFFSELSSLTVFITILCLIEGQFFSQLVFLYAIALFLIGLSIFDILTKRLPDIATLPFLLLGLCQSFWLQNIDFQDSVFGGIGGGLMTGIVATIYNKMRGEVGIGWGDVKLISAFGAWIGWQALPLFIFLSSILGILFIFLRFMAKQQFNVKEQIPFGPFLCVSGWFLLLQTLNSS